MSDTQNEIEFVDGLIAKAPRDGAPDFIKAALSIRREALIAWLQARDGEWVNVDVKEARSGKWYCSVDAWKPKEKQEGQRQERAPSQQNATAPAGDDPYGDDVPFRQFRHHSYS
jgi:hypothetical protein